MQYLHTLQGHRDTGCPTALNSSLTTFERDKTFQGKALVSQFPTYFGLDRIYNLAI